MSSKVHLLVLHASLGINFKLNGLNRATETSIILPCVLVICVAFRIVDMLLRSVNSEAFIGHCSPLILE